MRVFRTNMINFRYNAYTGYNILIRQNSEYIYVNINADHKSGNA